MKNKLIVLVLSVLFLAPTASHAATLDEQRTVILSQLITLLEAQIADLEAQLVAQKPVPVLGAVPQQATTTTTKIATTTEIYICGFYDKGC